MEHKHLLGLPVCRVPVEGGYGRADCYAWNSLHARLDMCNA
jgi:hypothetical protein